jgi:hypothetical protein
MPTWCFKTADPPSDPSSPPQWYWQIETDAAPIAILSSRVFASLDECVAHARENGFRGDVDVPRTMTYPAVIRCQDDDYVPYLLNRSKRGRSNRSAR